MPTEICAYGGSLGVWRVSLSMVQKLILLTHQNEIIRRLNVGTWPGTVHETIFNILNFFVFIRLCMEVWYSIKWNFNLTSSKLQGRLN